MILWISMETTWTLKAHSLKTSCTKMRYMRWDSEALWHMEGSCSVTGNSIGTTIMGILCSYSFDHKLLIGHWAVYKKCLQSLILLVGISKHLWGKKQACTLAQWSYKVWEKSDSKGMVTAIDAESCWMIFVAPQSATVPHDGKAEISMISMRSWVQFRHRT